MFGDDQQDYKTDEQMANTMGISPESLANMHEPAQYDYRHGFSDIDVLSSLKGFTEEVPVIETQDLVSEFIAQSESRIEFNSDGQPYLHASIPESLDHSEAIATLETSPVEVLAKFDQED
ncbi:MAG: hypothetical protein JNL11_03340 [Bdellovibrionaceae bacterium]|nr:hypothetical protein [Pseudobdellovibrionaceae bacterium]